MLATAKTLATLAATHQLPRYLPIARQDEIGDLIGGFNRLLERLGKQGEALRESETRFRKVFEESPFGMVMASTTDGRFFAVNDTYCRMLGYTEEELKRLTFVDVIHPEYRSTETEEVKRLLAGQIPRYRAEQRNLRKDGEELWVALTALVVRSEDEKPLYVLAITEDVTERKRAEEQLAALNAELEAKVEARTKELAIALDAANETDRLKSDFMANVTHELRTPLNSVIGFSGLLKDEVPGPLNAKQAAFAADILASGQRLLALVEGILEMSRLDAAGAALEREPVEIGAALEERVATHRTAAKAQRVSIALDVATDAGRAELDPKALRRMLDVLIDNAIKFNREGGTVAVSARRAGGALEIAVADTGTGIAGEGLPKLFKPLVQLDAGLARRHGGVGMGLSLVRRLAELHGGTIEVESKFGKGSTFTLRLPSNHEPIARIEP